MSQIQIPNIRKGTDVNMKASLTDSGVRVDWSTLDNIAAYIYSGAQQVIAGKCSGIHVDPEDNTALLVEYPYTENQYLGVQSLVIVADYLGQHCTFDKKAFAFVATTDETDDSTSVDDDAVLVDIAVEDVDSSILSAAIRAALEAAEDAEEAAHLIPLQVLQDCREATDEAITAKGNADDAADEARAAGVHAVPIIGQNGNWWKWDAELGEYVDTGEPSRGIQGPQGVSIQSIEQTQTSEESHGFNIITVTLDNGQTSTFQVRNGSQGATGAPGVANAKYKQVDTLPTASEDTMEYIYLVESSTSGIYNMSYTEYDPETETYSWHSLGTTAIQLSDYATKAEVNQLGQEIMKVEGGVLDITNTLSFEQGGISTSNGSDQESYLQIRSNFIECDGVTVTVTNGYVYVYGWNGDTYLSAQGWNSGTTTIVIAGATKYKVVFKRNTNVNLAPSQFDELGASVKVVYNAKAVMVSAQTFTESEKEQARTNIGAVSDVIVNGIEFKDYNVGKISAKYIANSYVKSDGSFDTYNGWTRTDYINVSLFSSLIITATVASTYNAFYDKEKTFIKAFSLSVGTNKLGIPKDACYIVISNTNAGTLATTFVIDEYRFATKINRLSSFFVGYYTTSGAIETSKRANWRYAPYHYCPDYIPVEPGNSVVWNFAHYDNSAQCLIIYDSTKTLLTYYSANTNAGTRTITMPADAAFIRITFGLTMPNNTPNKTPVIVAGTEYIIDDQTLDNNARLALIPEDVSHGIIGEVYPEEVAVVENQLEAKLPNRFHFIHISDNHGGSFGYAQEYLDYSPAKFLINTGDLVADKFADKDLESFQTITLATEPTKPVYLALGNHDYSHATSRQAVFDAFIAPTNTHNGTAFDKTYYSIDFSTEKVKCIILDMNDGWPDADLPDLGPSGDLTCGKMSQTQINWLATQLQDAITNSLDVVIFIHTPPAQVSRFNRVKDFSDTINLDYARNLTFLPGLIDAFINGETATFIYDGNNYSFTFASGGHFVSWVCGHEHGDLCGWMDGHENQFIAVVCRPYRDTSVYGGSYDGDKLGVHWNYCTVDTDRKSFSVYRMGQQTTVFGTERVSFRILYK